MYINNRKKIFNFMVRFNSTYFIPLAVILTKTTIVLTQSYRYYYTTTETYNYSINRNN